jgi:predicted secreted Zn-dependent protease
VSKLAFTWRFVMTLPKARDEARLATNTRQLWRSFVARLRAHELHHRDLFVACGRSFVPAAAAMTAKQCSTLDRQVRHHIDARYDACMEQQFAYDRIDTPRIQSHPFIRLAKQ